MTRDEAIKALWIPGTQHDWAMDRSAAADLVDRLVAVGVLKLDATKTKRQIFIDTLKEAGYLGEVLNEAVIEYDEANP